MATKTKKNPRLGRCYELAAQEVLYGDDPTAILVHGSIQGGDNPRLHHAWVQYEDEYGDEMAYDPVADYTGPWGLYARMFNAEPYTAYTSAQVRTYILEHKNWGPWHLEAERAGVLTGSKVKPLEPRPEDGGINDGD
jgi:hypothetical protein